MIPLLARSPRLRLYPRVLYHQPRLRSRHQMRKLHIASCALQHSEVRLNTAGQTCDATCGLSRNTVALLASNVLSRGVTRRSCEQITWANICRLCMGCRRQLRKMTQLEGADTCQIMTCPFRWRRFSWIEHDTGIMAYCSCLFGFDLEAFGFFILISLA